MLEELLREVAEYYADDPTTAGVVAAWLPGRQVYYINVSRYRGKHGTCKQVIACAENTELEGAVVTARKIWLANRKQS